jgi:hypothetical protein
MKCVIPLYTKNGSNFAKGLPPAEVKLFLEGLFWRLADQDDHPNLVSDSEEILQMASQAGAVCVLSRGGTEFARDRLLPWDARRALADLEALGGLDTKEPVMLVDPLGPGVLASVRQEARQLFEQGKGLSLLSLSPAEDHPVQVRAYHFMLPLGLAYFDLTPRQPGQGGSEDDSSRPRLERTRSGEALLRLPRPLMPGEETLSLFALTQEERFQPLAAETTPDDTGTLKVVLPPGLELKAILALHLAVDKKRRSCSFCAVPVLFEGSPWVLGQPNHLYACTPCVSTATGRPVFGRQDFPHILLPSRYLAIVTPGRIMELEQDVNTGRCLGYVCEQDMPPTARLLWLLRQEVTSDPRGPVRQDPGELPTLFPPNDVLALRALRGKLTRAMTDLDSKTGETAAYVKGFFDFLYETTLRREAPELLHTGV